MTATRASKEKAADKAGEKKAKGKTLVQKAKETAPAKRTAKMRAALLAQDKKAEQAKLRALEKEISRDRAIAVIEGKVGKVQALMKKGHKKFDVIALD